MLPLAQTPSDQPELRLQVAEIRIAARCASYALYVRCDIAPDGAGGIDSREHLGLVSPLVVLQQAPSSSVLKA
jgi:hypothetical protein